MIDKSGPSRAEVSGDTSPALQAQQFCAGNVNRLCHVHSLAHSGSPAPGDLSGQRGGSPLLHTFDIGYLAGMHAVLQSRLREIGKFSNFFQPKPQVVILGIGAGTPVQACVQQGLLLNDHSRVNECIGALQLASNRGLIDDNIPCAGFIAGSVN
jgi:hypothetical protein